MQKKISLQEYIQSPFSSYYVNKLIGVRLKHTIYSILITFAGLFAVGLALKLLFDPSEELMATLVLLAFPAFYFSHLWVESFSKDLPYAICLGNDTLATLTAGSMTFDVLTKIYFDSPCAQKLYKAISKKGRGFYGFEIDLLEGLESRYCRGKEVTLPTHQTA